MSSFPIPRALAASVAMAMLLLSAPLAQPALADDATSFAELQSFLDEVGTWTSGLASVGKFAEPIPVVGRSAGSVLGFPDLVQKAVADEIATLASWTDLDGTKEFPFDLGDGRSGTLTTTLSTAGSTRTIDVHLEATATLDDEPFSFASESPQLSLSSSGGLAVTGEVDLEFSVVVEPSAAPTGYTPFLVAGPSTPSLAVDIAVELPQPPGGLSASVGILGVTVTEATADGTDASLHLVGTIADPDSDGRLHFTRPDGTAGELADPSSLAGLAAIDFRSVGDGGAGAVDIDVAVSADPGSAGLSLPGVNATIGIDWPDVSTGAPTVTATGLGSVQDFLRMSPRDLADVLAQLVTLVAGAQRTQGQNLELPFLSGTLADAVRGAEALAEFLRENVVQPPTDAQGNPIPDSTVDPAQVGLPSFVSIQDLVQALRDFSGTTTVSDVDIAVDVGDYADQRLPIDLTITRASSGPIDLVPPGASTSGTASYGADSLTDTTATFDPAVVGQRVVAGASGGTIQAVSADQHTLTLTGPWTGGQPADDSPYSIANPEVNAGAVNLADLLTGGDGRGITDANAIAPTATVTPDYTTRLKFALDLTPPRTGADCVGPTGSDPDDFACPYERDNPDGTKTIITEEPLPVERLLVGTGYNLLEADFPIEAGIDVFARAGFLGVRLGGTVKVCATGAAADCSDPTTGDPMLAIALNPKTGDPADGYVPITDFFPSLVTDPLERLGFATNVRGHVAGSVSVPDAEAFLPGGASAGFTINWANVGTGSPDIVVDDLSEILSFDIDPSDPQALLGVVMRVLQLLDQQLRAGGGSGLLAEKIPMVDRSLGELLGADESGGGPLVTYATTGTGDDARTVLTDAGRAGDRLFSADLPGRSIVVGTQVGVVREVSADGTELHLTPLATQPSDGTVYTLRSELADAISLLSARPPDTLQQLIGILDERLGGDFVRFRYEDLGGAPHLGIDLDWRRDFSTEEPVQFSLGDATIAGAKGTGTAKVDVGADIDVDLAVPLALPADLSTVPLKIMDTSHVAIDAQASASGDLTASLGPLSLSLGLPGDDDSDARIDARYSLGFAHAAPTGAATDLAGFFSSVTPTVNGYTGEVDCGEADTGDDLALCADLPLYVSADGTNWSPVLSPIAVRLPKDGADATELFSLAGPVSGDDARLRLEAPTPEEIATAFQDALLNFALIGEGLDAFLALIEKALTEASMEGKLPVAGADLQAGSDFVGRIRTEMTALFDEIESVNGGRLSGEQIEEYLDTKFKEALTAAGANPENFDLVLTCTLRPADVTSVEGNGDETGTTAYEYAVVAVGTLNGADVDTMPGESGTITDRPATLDADNTNTVAWDAVPGATKYRVLRRDGAHWDLLATVTGTSYEDADSTAVETDDFAVTDTLATIDDCPSIANTDIQGVVLRVDMGTGTVDGTSGCTDATDKPCLGTTVPIDVGVPGLSLRPAREGGTGGVSAKVGWGVHLAMELSREHGLALLTQDQSLPELGVGLNLDLAATEADPLRAELAFLNIDVSKPDEVEAPAFAAAFQLDLKSGAGAPSCFSEPCPAPDHSQRLGFAELSAATTASDVVAVQLDLHLNVDWLLKASADASLPGIQARLVMQWDETIGNPAAADGTGLVIAFNDVALDAGAFLDSVLGPIVREIKKVTGPVQPVIDTLYTPLPVLSDLSKLAGGGDVTIVTLAKTFSTLADGPDLEFVDTVAGVISFVNNLPEPGAGNLLIPIGSFTVVGDKAFSTAATPDTGASLIGTRAFTDDEGNTVAESAVGLRGSIDERSTSDALAGGEADGAGFDFPVLDNPGLLFNLIMGADVDLVTFDSGPLELAFTWRQSFGPVYAPPPVFITLSGTASVTARIVAGFDTYGLRKVFEEGVTGSSVAGILNGLYFKSTDDNGNPLPVVTFYGEIAAGAAVSAVVITVGVEGGVSLTIALAWNDPNGDGKFRLFEFGQVALNNPICLFQMSGRIGIFLRVYITLGVSPFSVSFNFTLADITLLDFNVKPDCDPPPPRLGGVVDSDGSGDYDTLVVFAGRFGSGAVRGHDAWSNTGDGYEEDVVKVVSLHTFAADGTATPRGVKVEALGISESWEGEEFAGISRVVVDGRGYDRTLKVTMVGDGDPASAADVVPTGGFDLEAVVIGGSADDTIKAGTGRSRIAGEGGADTITASDTPVDGRVSWIAGGAGDDSLMTGDADAIAAGDSHLRGNAGSYPVIGSLAVRLADTTDTRTLTDVVDWGALAAPSGGEAGSDGADRLAVGLGTNTSYGNGGDDVVAVAADSELAVTRPDEAARWRAKPNTIVLGTGSDNAKGGSHDDTIWTAREDGQTRGDGQVDGGGDTDTGALRNVVDTGHGSDTVFGGTAPDLVTGGSQPDESLHARGGDGNDVLVGGHGTDELFGGPGQDWVVAEPATISDETGTDAFGVVRTYSKAPLPSGVLPSSKLLVGGDHADRVVGGHGGARIFGDRLEDVDCGSVATGDQPESTPPAEPMEGTPGRDLILGGDGADVVKAGGEADRVEAYAAADLLCGQDGNDELFAGAGSDVVWAGSGNDVAYGDADADRVYGNDGDDQLFGGAADDTIEGNDGSDTAFGGTGGDTILGGTRAPGMPDTGDTLYGDEGPDVLIGDNGSNTEPYDLDASNLDAGGPDTIFGGADDDRAFGGLENDAVSGGPGDDHLQGNHADDTVHGDAGEDQLVGGSAEEAAPGVGRPDGTDTLFGGDGTDLITGDNAILGIGDDPTPLVGGRGFALDHELTLLDLGYSPTPGTSARDVIRGGAGNDVALGQGGDDELHGEGGDDYLEGNADADDVFGGDGEDDLVGGSSTAHAPGQGQPDTGDTISGGDAADVVLGDNGSILRTGTPHPLTEGRGMTARALSLLDLGEAPLAGSSGPDLVTGDAGTDVLLGQDGPDRLKGGDADDYVEGGPGPDWVEGGAGDDDLVGGSYTALGGTGDATAGQPDTDDVVWGGVGDDVVTGDNAQVLRGPDGRTKATDRVGTTTPATRMTARTITLLDLRADEEASLLDAVPAHRYGADHLSGGDGVDVLWGQDGDDLMSGGSHDDYLEGNGGADELRGDQSLTATSPHFGDLPAPADPGWPGGPGTPEELEGTGGDDGQDDLIGGSTTPAFRDGDDRIQGDGGADVQLGDNGSLVRTLTGAAGGTAEAVYVERYPAGAVPDDATVMRSRDTDREGPSTRFCDDGLPQCEPTGAFGDDRMFGDAGDDGMWAQDGDDELHGGDGHDDMFGELGDDLLFGDAGEDALLGDRGGVFNEHLNDDSGATTVSLSSVPQESYTGRSAGSYDRRVDLLHDTDGNEWAGGPSDPAMAHPGLLVGGDDRIRGGTGDDQIHAGWGDDLANGDSGGDEVFGGDGADVLWGGKGCDPAAGECPTVDGAPDLSFRGTADDGGVDAYVDHLFGGRGGAVTVSVEGADVLDWAPRLETDCADADWPVDNADGTTSDPCAWVAMTNLDNDDVADNQHHHGTDWMYGGWDRDVMQGDVAANGPNPGDRMMDWNGAYNLWSHCNAAYGGFNDVRQHSPAMREFVQQLAWGSGAGQTVGDVTTDGTSAFREVAIAYSEDNKQHAAGKAFPGTPGHFDAPVACAP